MSPQETDAAGGTSLSISDLLQRAAEDVVIPAGEARMGPEEAAFRRLFFRVEVESFADLRSLGIFPRSLDEDAVLQALARDRDQAGALQRPKPAVERGRVLRPHLARVLSEFHGREIAPDATAPAYVAGWVRRLDDRPRLTVGSVRDLTLEHGATLRVSARAHVLVARDVRLHRTATVVLEGQWLTLRGRRFQASLD